MQAVAHPSVHSETGCLQLRGRSAWLCIDVAIAGVVVGVAGPCGLDTAGSGRIRGSVLRIDYDRSDSDPACSGNS